MLCSPALDGEMMKLANTNKTSLRKTHFKTLLKSTCTTFLFKINSGGLVSAHLPFWKPGVNLVSETNEVGNDRCERNLGNK